MAEKNFFDLLKEKMAALRPSSQHSKDDWAALTARLDQAMPQQAPDRRRSWLPLLLLLLALLLSNALWWYGNKENRIAMQGLELELASLQTSIAALKSTPPNIRTDTVWRTVYLRVPNLEQYAVLSTPRFYETANQSPPIDNNNLALGNQQFPRQVINSYTEQQEKRGDKPSANKPGSPNTTLDTAAHIQDNFRKTAAVEPLQLPDLGFLKSSSQGIPFAPEFLPDSAIRPYQPERPLVPVLLNALKPKYVKVGVIAGWEHPLGSELLHQFGLETGAQGAIGFSRHWSLILEYTYGQLHYEANRPSAIWGSPEFPSLPSSDYQYKHLNLKRQFIHQFGLGMRYTFSEWRNSRPYVGLNWSNLSVMPYKVAFEIQHEPSSTIQQGTLSVNERVRLRNIFRLGAGLEFPLSRQFDLTVEGFYSRQWKKKNNGTLDMTGLRVGFNWIF